MAEEFAKANLEVKNEFDKLMDQTNKQEREYDRLRNLDYIKDMYEKNKDKLIRKVIDKNTDTKYCLFEKRILDETLDSIDKKYDFEKHPQIFNIAEQIVKLKINDFRLSIANKNYGVLRISEERGKEVLTINPALAYSLDISKKIGELLEKLDNIVNGQKQTIEVSTTVTISDIMKRIIDVKNEEDEK